MNMPLQLVYKATTSIPVELDALSFAALHDMSLAEIKRILIAHGNERRPLAEFFSVTGSAADGRIEFEGDLSGVHGIGTKLSAGTTIHVEGHVGRHLGSEMTGGEIHVSGDAGDWVGGEMSGGLIHVRGRAGNLVGSAYRGSRRGMTGGTILIDGPVGNELGHTMRRGLVAVGGCGDFAGINMIAGTILVFGPAGIRAGAGMRRGTIGLLGNEPARLLPTFRAGGRDKLLVLQLVLRELSRLDYRFDPALLNANYRMHHGDLVTGGRGELLVPERAVGPEGSCPTLHGRDFSRD